MYFSSVGGRQSKKAQLFDVGMQVLLCLLLLLLPWPCLAGCQGVLGRPLAFLGKGREGKRPGFTAAPSVCKSQPGPQVDQQSPGQRSVSPPPSPEGSVRRNLASWGLHQEVSDQPWVPPECLEVPCHAFFLPEGATLPSVSQTCSPSPSSPQPLKCFLSDLPTAPEAHCG